MQNKKSKELPFLLSAPLNSKDGMGTHYKKSVTNEAFVFHVGTCILTALPPYADDSCKRLIFCMVIHIYTFIVVVVSVSLEGLSNKLQREFGQMPVLTTSMLQVATLHIVLYVWFS